jgi:hypothetical protein
MIALSESRLPDCLIETSYEGHSKTALAKPFGSLLFPASRSWINFALPWIRRLGGNSPSIANEYPVRIDASKINAL